MQSAASHATYFVIVLAMLQSADGILPLKHQVFIFLFMLVSGSMPAVFS